MHRYVAAPTKCIIFCKCGKFPQIAEFINPVRATRHTLSLPMIYALYYFFSISPARFLSFSISLFFSTHFLCLLLLYLSPSSPHSRFLSFSISLFFSTHFLCLLLLYLSLSSPPARILSFSISLFFSTHFLCLPYLPCSFFSFNPIFLFSLYLELRLSSFSHPIMLCPFFLLFLYIHFLSFPFCLSVYLSFSMSPWLVSVTVEGLYYI